MSADQEPSNSPLDAPTPLDGPGGTSDATASAQAGPDDEAQADGSPPESTAGGEAEIVRRLLRQFADLADYGRLYLAVRADRWILSAQTSVLRLLTAGLIGVAVVVLVVQACWLSLVGLADGLSVLCGDRPWAGKLLAGTGVLGGLLLTHVGVRAWLVEGSRKRTAEKYEEFRVRRRARDERDGAQATTGRAE